MFLQSRQKKSRSNLPMFSKYPEPYVTFIDCTPIKASVFCRQGATNFLRRGRPGIKHENFVKIKVVILQTFEIRVNLKTVLGQTLFGLQWMRQMFVYFSNISSGASFFQRLVFRLGTVQWWIALSSKRARQKMFHATPNIFMFANFVSSPMPFWCTN